MDVLGGGASFVGGAVFCFFSMEGNMYFGAWNCSFLQPGKKFVVGEFRYAAAS